MTYHHKDFEGSQEGESLLAGLSEGFMEEVTFEMRLRGWGQLMSSGWGQAWGVRDRSLHWVQEQGDVLERSDSVTNH